MPPVMRNQRGHEGPLRNNSKGRSSRDRSFVTVTLDGGVSSVATDPYAGFRRLLRHHISCRCL